MRSWSDLLNQFQSKGPEGPNWLNQALFDCLKSVSERRHHSTVMFYASSFLQKPEADKIDINREDINGFMNALIGAPTERGLTLILHTPGGDPNAVESIVEYLHSKFSYIEVVVPYLAMSGGAMISLASDKLILGRQSQLGPIDPQFRIGNRYHSARAIQEGFEQAKTDIGNDIRLAHLWAPILQNMGPSLVLEATKSLSYSKELVRTWLQRRDLIVNQKDSTKSKTAETVAAYFNAEKQPDHGQIHVHGQRIGTAKLVELDLKVEKLEADQELQDEILTAYHLMTLIFETATAVKFIAGHPAKLWVKHQQQIVVPQPVVGA